MEVCAVPIYDHLNMIKRLEKSLTIRPLTLSLDEINLHQRRKLNCARENPKQKDNEEDGVNY